MYKSPIDIIYGQMETKLEGTIMKAVQNVHVNVDKEELIRALQYDRGQYKKGYMDAMDKQKWIPVTERLPEMSLVRYEDSVEPTGYGECLVSEKVLAYCPSENGVYVTECTAPDESKPTYWCDAESGKDLHPTHWMPLPEPPKGE